MYPAGSDEQAADAHYTSTRDQGMGWEMRTWAQAQDPTIVFGDTIGVQHDVNKAGLDFFDRFFASENASGGRVPSGTR
ncbi:MAG: hypothetical protein LAP38_29230 [Acidobacteriia bacterium]|nr:hypothetical protein [Terriglobia bacterium]